MEALEELKMESKLLKTFDPDEPFEDIFITNPLIQKACDKVLPLYEGTYPVNDDKIIFFIRALSYLACEEKLQEFLVYLHFNSNKQELLFKLNSDMNDQYNLIIPENTMNATFIKYNLINPLKYLPVTDTDLVYACTYNYLDIAQLIYSRINIRDEVINLAFQIACQKGYLNIARWLYSLNRVKLSLKENTGLFYYTWKIGHINLAYWLHSLGNINDQELFFIAFRNANLGFLKLLYSSGNVDIHFDDDIVFYTACTIGNLNFAQWVYSLGGISQRQIYISALASSSPAILNWLQTLHPN